MPSGIRAGQGADECDLSLSWTVKLPGTDSLLLSPVCATACVLQTGQRRVHLLVAEAASGVGRQLSGLDSAVSAAAVCPNAPELVLGDVEGDLHKWHLDHVEELASGPGPAAQGGDGDPTVTHIACNHTCIAAASGRFLSVYNKSLEKVLTLPATDKHVSALEWLGEHTLVVACNDHIATWHISMDGHAMPGPILVLDVLGTILNMAISPCTDLVAAMSEDLVHVWSLTDDMINGKIMPMRTLEGPVGEQPTWVGWHPNGVHVLAAFGPELYAWDVQEMTNGKHTTAVTCCGFDSGSAITMAAAQPDAMLLAALTHMGQVLLFDCTTIGVARPGSVVYAIAWSRVGHASPDSMAMHLAWHAASTIMVATEGGEVTCFKVTRKKQGRPFDGVRLGLSGRASGELGSAGARSPRQLSGRVSVAASDVGSEGEISLSTRFGVEPARTRTHRRTTASVASASMHDDHVLDQRLQSELSFGVGYPHGRRPSSLAGLSSEHGSEAMELLPQGLMQNRAAMQAGAGLMYQVPWPGMPGGLPAQPMFMPYGAMQPMMMAGDPMALAQLGPGMAAAGMPNPYALPFQPGMPPGMPVAAYPREPLSHLRERLADGWGGSPSTTSPASAASPRVNGQVRSHAGSAAGSAYSAQSSESGAALGPHGLIHPMQHMQLQGQGRSASHSGQYDAAGRGRGRGVMPVGVVRMGPGMAPWLPGSDGFDGAEGIIYEDGYGAFADPRLAGRGVPAGGAVGVPGAGVRVNGVQQTRQTQQTRLAGACAGEQDSPQRLPGNAKQANAGKNSPTADITTKNNTANGKQQKQQPKQQKQQVGAAAGADGVARVSGQVAGASPAVASEDPEAVQDPETVTNIYVGNLAPTVGAAALEAVFSQFGPLVLAEVITDPVKGKSKGFGFVQFESHLSATMAMKHMHGMTLAGPFQDRAIKVLPSYRTGPVAPPGSGPGGGKSPAAQASAAASAATSGSPAAAGSSSPSPDSPPAHPEATCLEAQ
eukprot:CAMPEP_0202858780 /NCGR_PEP_ID=MMETSP1391-20130828/1165_1 /ASSEMBLY_ACC=CAM_ASM_000867 /TAXON_ID=1034604 /ORGANISM="Chlamydomonas leiostraca, Strain SAG 11-49" /LENGTH=996 /DNA_ID=CAMNT_0049537735 /DNA_START=96 /DNA_END=3086 /DNA_ORIENTATION=+